MLENRHCWRYRSYQAEMPKALADTIALNRPWVHPSGLSGYERRRPLVDLMPPKDQAQQKSNAKHGQDCFSWFLANFLFDLFLERAGTFSAIAQSLFPICQSCRDGCVDLLRQWSVAISISTRTA